jgi:serine/threonine protein kinase
VPVYAVGDAHGMPYLVMRYVAGHSLAFRLWRGQPLAVAEVCRILAELASALHFAHRQNVVHRDIKPENVLLDKEAECTMLTDFGIARFGSLDAISMSEAQAERGMVRGTVQYMSPEQAAGEWEIDGRSDLYALGVLGYAMLSGRLPFEGTSFAQIAAMHASATPVPIPQLNPDVPPAVVEVIARCLEKHPEDRWSDGAALRGALIDAGLRPDARAAVGRGGGGFLSRVTPWTPWGKQRKRG